MKFEELVVEISRLEDTINKAKKELNKKKKLCWEAWQSDNPNASTVERFKAFIKYAQKKKYISVVHVKTKSGRDLWGPDGFFDPNRYQVWTIKEISEIFLECLSDPEELDNHYGTETEIHEWMEELIRLNFESMIYDW
jgi:hypothetical protein